MFYGRDTSVALTQNGTTLGVNDVLSNGINSGFTLHIDALYFITVVLGCRVERDSQVQTRMQAFSVQRKATFQSLLFHLNVLLFDCFTIFLFH